MKAAVTRGSEAVTAGTARRSSRGVALRAPVYGTSVAAPPRQALDGIDALEEEFGREQQVGNALAAGLGSIAQIDKPEGTVGAPSSWTPSRQPAPRRSCMPRVCAPTGKMGRAVCEKHRDRVDGLAWSERHCFKINSIHERCIWGSLIGGPGG
jgi:hypothetical protein